MQRPRRAPRRHTPEVPAPRDLPAGWLDLLRDDLDLDLLFCARDAAVPGSPDARSPRSRTAATRADALRAAPRGVVGEGPVMNNRQRRQA